MDATARITKGVVVLKVYELIRELAKCDPMKDVAANIRKDGYVYDDRGHRVAIIFSNKTYPSIDGVSELSAVNILINRESKL